MQGCSSVSIPARLVFSVWSGSTRLVQEREVARAGSVCALLCLGWKGTSFSGTRLEGPAPGLLWDVDGLGYLFLIQSPPSSGQSTELPRTKDALAKNSVLF